MKCRDNICQEPQHICFVSLPWQGWDKAIVKLGCWSGTAAIREPHKVELKAQKASCELQHSESSLQLYIGEYSKIGWLIRNPISWFELYKPIHKPELNYFFSASPWHSAAAAGLPPLPQAPVRTCSPLGAALSLRHTPQAYWASDGISERQTQNWNGSQRPNQPWHPLVTQEITGKGFLSGTGRAQTELYPGKIHSAEREEWEWQE